MYVNGSHDNRIRIVSKSVYNSVYTVWVNIAT